MELNVIRKDIESETRYSIYRDLELTFMGNLVKARSYRLVSAYELIDSELTIESIVKISDKDSGIIQTKSAVNDIIANYERRGISIYGMITDKINNTFKDDYVYHSTNEELVKENERLTRELNSDNSDFRTRIRELSDTNLNLVEENTKLKAMLDFNLNVKEAQSIEYQNAIKEVKDFKSRLDIVTEMWIKASSNLDFTIKQHAGTCKGYESELDKLNSDIIAYKSNIDRLNSELEKAKVCRDIYYDTIGDKYSTIETLKEQVVELESDLAKSVNRVKQARADLLKANKDKWEFLQERNKLRGELENYKSMVSKPVDNYEYYPDFIAHINKQFIKYSNSLSIEDRVAFMGGSDIATEFQNWLDLQNNG